MQYLLRDYIGREYFLVASINWHQIAKAKICKDRLMAWATGINVVMLVCLNLKIALLPEHIFALLMTAFAATYIDMKYILPCEQEYYFKRNPEWKKRNDR